MTNPSHIGQYRIVRKIGAGGMGVVFLGEHMLLGRRAAIKTLLPTVAANREIVERFFNEARATSAIADPGVIQIFDFGYHVDGTAYIVMELLEGEALSARLERLGKLALGDALRLARQIAGSLTAAHARDIVHRDLKPENIFLVRDAEAQGGERTKIIDFGVCKVGAGDPNLTEVGAMIGTPVYMSPEQCRGTGEVDLRSDVYAFGCLLFHLVTGRPPFVGDASGDLIVAHLQTPPPAASQHRPGLPAALDALLLRCLAKSPAERFPSMIALQHALGELAEQCAGAEVTATPPPATVPLGRGFCSVYDANLAALLSGSTADASMHQLLRSRLGFARPFTPSGEDATGEQIEDEVLPSRRSGVRAALACVLVVGVAVGLIVTPLVLEGEAEPPAAPARSAVALPVQTPVEAPAPAALVPAALGLDATASRPERPAATPATMSAATPATTSDAADDPPSRAGGRAPAHASKPASASRGRVPAESSVSGRRTSRLVTSSASARPVTSPEDLPAAPARAALAPSLPAPSPTMPVAPSRPLELPERSASASASSSAAASSAAPRPASPPAGSATAAAPAAAPAAPRPASPPPPPPEDLYDTR